MNIWKNSILFFVWPALLLCAACEKKDEGKLEPPSVQYTRLTAEKVDLKREAPGRVMATRMAEVRPQAGGILRERLFREGDEVKSGQILYKIDDAPLKAALKEARARLARAIAREDAARRHMDRCILLAKNNAVRAQERDDAIASYKEVEAEIAASREQTQRAAIELGYADIKAPISGKIGRSHVREGALLSPGQTEALAVIHKLDPVYVDVSLPASELLSLRQAAARGLMDESGNMTVELLLENGSPYSSLNGKKLPGKMLFSETTADEQTGTVAIRTIFPNPDSLLFPGMYVLARLPLGTIENAISIPQRCVARDNRNRPVVYVLRPAENGYFRLEERLVNLQMEHEGKWVAADGLKAGELILTEGLKKAKDGLLVKGQPDKERE